MAVSCTEFALVSGDVVHPPYDVARQKLYFFIMEPTVCSDILKNGLVQDLGNVRTGGLPFKNSFYFILTPTPHMLGIGRNLLISRAQKTQH
jgi:hypothetical protein